MSLPLNVALVVALLIPLWVLLRRDFIKGLAYGVFVCVSMPTYLRIQVPGNLPQLTIYRLVLIIVFFFWLRNRSRVHRLSDVPLFGAFCFWGLADLASLLLTSGDAVVGLKRYLDFVLETAVFFLVVVTSLRQREQAMKILRAACLGATLVATLAFVEKYTGCNPVKYVEFATPVDPDSPEYVAPSRDVVSSYQHRILLGTGMAMAFPAVLALMLSVEQASRKRAARWLSLSLIVAACYFSNSRGPWLAAALAGAMLMVFGRTAIRRKLALLLLLAVVVLMARPGIVRSWMNDFKATADSDSMKGGTFRYRLELWNIAWTQISTSPARLLFGCGPGCGFGSTVDWKLSYRGGKEWEVWSWDNHLAYDLYQSGLVGLAASLTLYGAVLLAAWRFWRRAGPDEKGIMACLLASIAAYAFMLTNVLMFTKPVNFLFWSIAAVTFAIGRNPEAREAEEDSNAEPEARVPLVLEMARPTCGSS